MICQARSGMLCCCGWLPLMSQLSEGVDLRYKLLLYCKNSNQAHVDAMNITYLMKSQKCISRLFEVHPLYLPLICEIPVRPLLLTSTGIKVCLLPLLNGQITILALAASHPGLSGSPLA